MLTIKFTKDADPVSDYEVEEFYQTFKNSTTLMICNNLVLRRFMVGVKVKEIPQFELEVTDIDGTVVKEICGKNGCLCDAYNTIILNMDLNMSMTLM